MITSLHLKDFESHKNTFLEFPSYGLTVFIGESDKGKSGTFRGFDWLRSNSLGSTMLPLYWDSKCTEVTVELEDGNKIVRSKGKSLNNYSIIYENGEEWESNAGTDTPKEVKELLNMEDIHFQSQIDRPFLMFETAGERGRILNRIAGLDKIDSTIKNANSDVKKIESNKKTAEKDIKQLEEELEEFENLHKIKKLLSESEEIDKKAEKLEEEIEIVEKIVPKKEKLEKILAKKGKLEELSKKLLKISEIRSLIKKNNLLLDKARSLKFKRKELQDKENKGKVLSDISKYIKKYEIEAAKYNTLLSLYNKTDGILLSESKKEDRLAVVEVKIKNIKKILPKSCPTCGSVLKK